MRNKHFAVILILVLSIIISGCAQATEIPPTAVPADTKEPPTAVPEVADTEVPPTTPPEPTATNAPPTATSLPEGVLFRDDFEGSLQPGWVWENENPDLWSITDDGWLQIIGEDDGLLGNNYQNNLLWHSLPEGEFVITVHLKAKPFANFHQATIYIYEDPENYIAINRGYCDICETGGGGFYMEYKINNQWGAYQKAIDAEDVYLRLESKENILSGFYATEAGEWERLGRFGNYFQFSEVGIGVTNLGAEETLVGLFDFFEISLP